MRKDYGSSDVSLFVSALDVSHELVEMWRCSKLEVTHCLHLNVLYLFVPFRIELAENHDACFVYEVGSPHW